MRKKQQLQLVSSRIFLPIPSLLKKQQKYNCENLMESEIPPTDFSSFCVSWKIPRKAGAQMLLTLPWLMRKQKPFLPAEIHLEPTVILPTSRQLLLMRADLATLSLPLLKTSVTWLFAQILIGCSFPLKQDKMFALLLSCHPIASIKHRFSENFVI